MDKDMNLDGNKATLWVVGDSTLSSFNDKCYYPRYGYGTMLDKYLDQYIDVRNIALSGRSSKSYTTEPEYKKLLDGMKDGDFLLIGFGHNDEKTEAERYTQGDGDYTQAGTFAESLYRNYIVPAKKAGCQCILCTPIVRRRTSDKWDTVELHVVPAVGEFVCGDYPEAIRRLGLQLDIPIVDMTEINRKMYESMGCEETLYLHAWTSNREISVDNTHTNQWGARVNAYHVLEEVKKLGVEGISEHITGIEDGVPCKEKYLEPDPEYKPVVYTSDFDDSKIWPEIDGLKGTVFGDVGNEISIDTFVMEPIKNGTEGNGIHIEVKNNIGKIAPVTDGIAMYYKRISVKDNFILTAKAHINSYFLNDQVSFGLMVRDDMYIDMPTGDVLGDYVAAAPLMLTRQDKAWNCFARKSSMLTQGGICSRAYKAGDTVGLRIESTDDGYACTFGDEQTITGGFDFKLTSIDPEYVYAGVFVSRNANIDFTDIKYTMK